MDPLLALQKYLSDITAITNLVGSSSQFETWIFRYNFQMTLEKTGERAIVLKREGMWTAPNRHNTAKFPRIRVECWADPTRDANGMPTKADAEERAMALADAVDPYIHDPGNKIHAWDTLRIVNCTRISEPYPMTMENADAVKGVFTEYGAQIA